MPNGEARVVIAIINKIKKSLAVSVCTSSLNVKKSYILPTEYLCVLYVSEKEILKFSYTALADWFL